MSGEERRQNDDELLMLVREIHQRQQEVVIPKVESIENTLYDKDNGICKRMGVAEGEIKRIDRIDIKLWGLIGAFVTAILGYIYSK